MKDRIDFRCPHCNQRLGAKSETAGRQTTCPNCNGTVDVPDAADRSKFLVIANAITIPTDSTRRINDQDSQTNSNTSLNDIRLQIERGVVAPANTTFRDVIINDQFIRWSFFWGLVIGAICLILRTASDDFYYDRPMTFLTFAGYVTVSAAVFSVGIAIA